MFGKFSSCVFLSHYYDVFDEYCKVVVCFFVDFHVEVRDSCNSAWKSFQIFCKINIIHC